MSSYFALPEQRFGRMDDFVADASVIAQAGELIDERLNEPAGRLVDLLESGAHARSLSFRPFQVRPWRLERRG